MKAECMLPESFHICCYLRIKQSAFAMKKVNTESQQSVWWDILCFWRSHPVKMIENVFLLERYDCPDLFAESRPHGETWVDLVRKVILGNLAHWIIHCWITYHNVYFHENNICGSIISQISFAKKAFQSKIETCKQTVWRWILGKQLIMFGGKNRTTLREQSV